MPSAEESEVIKHHEFYLEDIHEGLIALDGALKLVARPNDNLATAAELANRPLSWSPAVNVVFYIVSAVARDIERLELVKSDLPPRAAWQLTRYSERLRQRNRKVSKLKIEDDLNRCFALRDARVQ
jgi:hypothetical protein